MNKKHKNSITIIRCCKTKQIINFNFRKEDTVKDFSLESQKSMENAGEQNETAQKNSYNLKH